MNLNISGKQDGSIQPTHNIEKLGESNVTESNLKSIVPKNDIKASVDLINYKIEKKTIPSIQNLDSVDMEAQGEFCKNNPNNLIELSRLKRLIDIHDRESPYLSFIIKLLGVGILGKANNVYNDIYNKLPQGQKDNVDILVSSFDEENEIEIKTGLHLPNAGKFTMLNPLIKIKNTPLPNEQVIDQQSLESNKSETRDLYPPNKEKPESLPDVIFTGQVKNGLPNGKGRLILSDSFYVGEFKDGEMHGLGSFSKSKIPEGLRVEGTAEEKLKARDIDKKPIRKLLEEKDVGKLTEPMEAERIDVLFNHGKLALAGNYIIPWNEGHYTGSMSLVDGKTPEGEGEAFVNGYKYIGKFKNGEFIEGTRSNEDFIDRKSDVSLRITEDGVFENDKLQKGKKTILNSENDGQSFEGSFESGIFKKGILSNISGSKVRSTLEGDFTDEKLNGQGVIKKFTFLKGEIDSEYKGNFHNNTIKTGEITEVKEQIKITYKTIDSKENSISSKLEGQFRAGTFRTGVLNGEGRIERSDGTSEEGNFENAFLEGPGQKTELIDGKLVTKMGIFKDGKLIEEMKIIDNFLYTATKKGHFDENGLQGEGTKKLGNLFIEKGTFIDGRLDPTKAYAIEGQHKIIFNTIKDGKAEIREHFRY